MGVTRLETKNAVYYFDHEGHNIDFTAEVKPEKIDTFVIESRGDVTPDNRSQMELVGGFPRVTLLENIPQAYEFAKSHGLDVWITDVPVTQATDIQIALNPLKRAGTPFIGLGLSWVFQKLIKAGGRYMFELESSDKRYLKEGAVADGLRERFQNSGINLPEGSVMSKRGRNAWVITREGVDRVYTLDDTGEKIRVYGMSTVTRRAFVTGSAVGLLAAAGGAGVTLNNIFRLIKSRRITGRLHQVGEVSIDNPERKWVAESGVDVDDPYIDLRNVVNAVKLEGFLSPLLTEELGDKPHIYLVYGSYHTGIIDYLKSPEKRLHALQRWGGSINRYLREEWIDAVTQWHFENGVWTPKVYRPKIPELEEFTRLPVGDIEGKEITRRELFRRVVRRT